MANCVAYGQVQTARVGVRHYCGRVNVGELVRLKREPHNVHNHRAIKVTDMAGTTVRTAAHLVRSLLLACCSAAPVQTSVLDTPGGMHPPGGGCGAFAAARPRTHST